MKMRAGTRALDKIYKRRDRYEIPDWQREPVWDQAKKQQLIDSILRGWKLPKFYFVKTSEDEYEVVDGQQRLEAIYEFFSNELSLSHSSADEFGGEYYKSLPPRLSDAFDDFEIEYDEIEEGTEEELKGFFQRLQAGLPLTSSEKLNAVHSKLRDFCRKTADHPFFRNKIAFPNTRYAHFDVIAKAAAIEIEGLDTGLRFEDIKQVFEANSNFSTTSAAAKRIRAALDSLDNAFQKREASLRSRTIAQSLITLTAKLVGTDAATGSEDELRLFYEQFSRELSRQVELGQAATDSDYVIFQRSVNANVRTGAKTRHEIFLRKLLSKSPRLATLFGPTIIIQSGTSSRVDQLGASIRDLVHTANKQYGAKHGEDLFKPTNNTAQALTRLGKPIADIGGYEQLMDDLYFLFRESVGQRLDEANRPQSFTDVNTLRTELRHDVDHGESGKVRAKKKKAGKTFMTYAGTGTPETLEPSRFVLAQANLLTAIEGDLKTIIAAT
jgi:Protein of unknown function DUF262